MNPVASLAELPRASERAVIINCGTKWVSSLALLSTLRHARCPVLVVDCESRDGSREHFARLAREQRLAFDWLAWPLRPHGVALDALFVAVPAERVLLVDSDVEILAPRVVDGMRQALDATPAAYGAGFVHGPLWMGDEHGLPASTGYYAERMWIPCVMLRVAPVREALGRGASFANRRAYCPPRGRGAGFALRSLAYRLARASPPRIARGEQTAPLPAAASAAVFVEYDTGADLHYALRRDGHALAALDAAWWSDVRHYHGVTRATLGARLRRAAAKLGLRLQRSETAQLSVYQDVRRRLAIDYGVDVSAYPG